MSVEAKFSIVECECTEWGILRKLILLLNTTPKRGVFGLCAESEKRTCGFSCEAAKITVPPDPDGTGGVAQPHKYPVEELNGLKAEFALLSQGQLIELFEGTEVSL